MPRASSVQSSLDKTKKYIRQTLQKRNHELKFTNYQSKNSIIYKLNKYHYLDTELHVIDLQVIKYLVKQAKNPNSIERVGLDLCNIKDQGLEHFMMGNWINVMYLTLGSNGLTAKGIKTLLKKDNLESLKHLYLNDNLLDANAGSVLADAIWAKIEIINLNFNSLGSLGLKTLQKNTWKTLKELYLLKNNITNQGIIGLVNMNIPGIQKILLGHNLLTDDGCKILAKGQWKQLNTLQLQGNYIKDDALEYLSQLGTYNLERLTLFASKTCIINTAEKTQVMATMGGMTWLCKGFWSGLKVEVTLNRFGYMSKDSFIVVPSLKDMLKIKNVIINMDIK